MLNNTSAILRVRIENFILRHMLRTGVVENSRNVSENNQQ